MKRIWLLHVNKNVFDCFKNEIGMENPKIGELKPPKIDNTPEHNPYPHSTLTLIFKTRTDREHWLEWVTNWIIQCTQQGKFHCNGIIFTLNSYYKQ